MGSSDAKLRHLVRKFLEASVESDPNADHIVHCLRTQHREYQRKDLDKLKKEVHKVLKQIKQSEDVGNGAGCNLGGTKDKEEEEYDKDAEVHDLQRSNNEEGTFGGLNASLIARYRKLQQDRADKAAADPEGVTADIRSREATPALEGGQLKKRSRGESGVSSSGNTNDKSFKRKRSHSKRLPSSSGLDAYQKGEGNREVAVSEAVPRPTERYSDLGGVEDILQQIRQLVEYPLIRPELYRHLGVDPPRGVLLRGPPG
jgi:ATP-dependent 26S proteasome regulatory subunit